MNSRKLTPINFATRILTGTVLFSLSLSAPLFAAGVEGVELTGRIKNEDTITPVQSDMAMAVSMAGTEAWLSFCEDGEREALMEQYNELENQAAMRLAEVGTPVTYSQLDDVRDRLNEQLDALEGKCDEVEPGAQYQNFKITYAYCRMLMDQNPNLLDIQVPAGGDGQMLAIGGNEGIRVNLKQAIATTEEKATGKGWSTNIQWTSGPGTSKEIAGYSASQYSFNYHSGMGEGEGLAGMASMMAAAGGADMAQYMQGAQSGNMMEMMAGMISTTNEGSGFFSQSAPGIDIVQSFYNNFATNVDTGTGFSTFFSGQLENLVLMLAKGMPLEMNQTVSSKVMGRIVASGRSLMEVFDVHTVALPSDWCTRDFTPAGVTITDVDEQIEQVLSQ